MVDNIKGLSVVNELGTNGTSLVKFSIQLCKTAIKVCVVDLPGRQPNWFGPNNGAKDCISQSFTMPSKTLATIGRRRNRPPTVLFKQRTGVFNLPKPRQFKVFRASVSNMGLSLTLPDQVVETRCGSGNTSCPEGLGRSICSKSSNLFCAMMVGLYL